MAYHSYVGIGDDNKMKYKHSDNHRQAMGKLKTQPQMLYKRVFNYDHTVILSIEFEFLNFDDNYIQLGRMN